MLHRHPSRVHGAPHVESPFCPPPPRSDRNGVATLTQIPFRHSWKEPSGLESDSASAAGVHFTFLALSQGIRTPGSRQSVLHNALVKETHVYRTASTLRIGHLPVSFAVSNRGDVFHDNSR